jgi:hypothetical protein
VRVELGAPILIAPAAAELWHILDERSALAAVVPVALCGLAGDVYAFGGAARQRRLCAVCRDRGPAVLHDPTAGTLAELEHELRPRRGRPAGSVRRLTPAQVQLLHRLYVNEQLSCYELARRIDWQKVGYRSERSAAMAIWSAFRELGLETRTRSTVVSMRNHRHGRCTRELRAAGADHGPDGYRAWLKRQRGEYRPQCAGVRVQYPRKGQRCTRPAMAGSEFCWAHDPARAAEREQHLAEMRRRQPRVGRPALEEAA